MRKNAQDMRFDLQALRRTVQAAGQAGAATEEPPKTTAAPESATRPQSETANRIEALLRAHPSIVHEIE